MAPAASARHSEGVTTARGATAVSRWLFATLRAIIAVLVGVAVGVQLHTSIGYWHGVGVKDVTVNVVNFFSFFTIDSNLLAMAVCAVGAVLLAVRGEHAPGWFTALRAAAGIAAVATGVVYTSRLGERSPAERIVRR